jgi:AcrR family transcriptional regulator
MLRPSGVRTPEGEPSWKSWEMRATRRRGSARERVLQAARTLFSEHSASGTSLQMIADRVGVTKAAVYHQFHTKEEIILALVEKPLAQVEAIVAEAEAMSSREAQLDVLLRGLVDVVIENPEAVRMIGGDPAVARLIQAREPFRDVIGRLADLLAGPHPDPAARVASVLYGAGLMLIGHHPLFIDIDASTIRSELPRIGRQILL